MASQGPLFPTAAAVIEGVIHWSNISNILASDNAYAIASFASAGYEGVDIALGKSFGFSIPAGKVIQGIVVEVEAKASHNSGSNYFRINGAAVLWNYGSKSGWKWPFVNVEVAEQFYSYGGAGDSWAAGLSRDDINSNGDAGFVVRLDCQMGSDGTAVTAYLDSMRATVYYGDTPLGYAHKVLGVAPANIAKIMGVPTANVGKFCGV